MQTRHFVPSSCAAAMACLLVAVAGCQSTKPSPLASWNPMTVFQDKDEEVPMGVPDRVVGAWTEAVLHKSGEGTRGFGGRLYFYERGSNEPIRVEGRLVVYAFEEDGREATDNRPTKRYVFPPEQFAKHESESEVGMSYSVWLPWDAAGGEQADVSLIARFEPLQGGGLVVSDQTRHRLPGRPRQDTMIAEQSERSQVTPASTHASMATGSNGQDAMAQAVYQQSARPDTPRMKTTTISLPDGFRGFGSGTSKRSTGSPGAPGVTTQPTAAPQMPAPKQAPDQAPIQAPAGRQPAFPSQGQSATGQGTQAGPQASPVRTTVEYLTAGESVQKSSRSRSFDSSPMSRPAAGGPAFQPSVAPTR